jgi:hypothetical protein
MRDVNYFIEQANMLGHGSFDTSFSDVIEVFDTLSTRLTTENKADLTINWDENGYFRSYHISQDTSAKVAQVIGILENIDVDGETMQYIIEKLGMADQMLRQLVLTSPYTDTSDLLEEKVRLSDAGIHL